MTLGREASKRDTERIERRLKEAEQRRAMTPEKALEHIQRLVNAHLKFPKEYPYKRFDRTALSEIVRIALQGLEDDDGRVQAHEAERPEPGTGQ